MNQSIRLSKAIKILIIILAALLFVAIWPGEFIQQKYISKSNELMAMESDPVSVEHNVTQMFVGEGGELSAVDLYVCNDMRGETITFRLYDAGYNEIFNTFHLVKDNQEFPGFVHIPVGYDLAKDQEYYFTLEGLTADMVVAYEDRETSTSIVNGFMSYGGIEIQKYNVIIRYEYSNPFVWWQILIFGVAIAAAASALVWGVSRLFEKKLTDREVKVHTLFKVVLNPIVIILGAILLVMIFPGRKIGRGMLDHIFFFGGTVLLILGLLFLINFKRTGKGPLIDIEAMKGRIPEYLQSICISTVIWYCCEYVNGLYDIHHSFSVRKILIWFFLSLICTYTKKELLRISNLGFLLVSGIVSYLYVRPYKGMDEEAGLSRLDFGLLLIGSIAIWLLLVNLIRKIRKKQIALSKIFIPYVGAFSLLLGFMIGFRNGRDWLVVMVVIFAVFYLRMWLWEKSNRIIEIIANGLVLNFICMVIYCLMHRPYQRFIFSRYGLVFHTATVTGIYLALMLSVIVVKFLIKLYKSQRIVDAWPELLLLCVANSYLFMTLSRTGCLGAIVAELFMVILFAIKKSEKKALSIVKHLGLIAVVTLLTFPAVFTTTRIVPAVVNDPILSDIELTGYEVRKGMPLNDRHFMKVETFLDLIGVKFTQAHEDARLYLNPEDIYVIDEEILVASAADDIVVNSTINNISNGRIDIFKEYIANWNLTGHEDMSITKADGAFLVHAHNVFLQVIHDCGLPTGILFVLFGLFSFIIAMIRYLKTNDVTYAFVIGVIIAFAVSGLVEWNFHLCNPFGMALFMVLTPLLFSNKDMDKNEQ